MAINIKSAEVDALVRQLTERTGETITEAVKKALEERLERTRKPDRARVMRAELESIRRRCAKLKVHDRRTPDEILGYDDQGLPT